MLNILYNLIILCSSPYLAKSTGSNNFKDYSGYKVLSVNISNKTELDRLRHVVKKYDLTTWNRLQVGEDIQVEVPPKISTSIFRNHDLVYSVMFNDLQRVIQSERMKGVRSTGMDESFHSNYHTSKEIFSHLQGIIASNPSMAKSITIGSTHLGQEIKGIMITNNIESKLTEQKPKLLIHGGQHAREWITVATAMFLIEEFINSKSALLDIFQIILVPILNIDGYDYTWDQDRLWRKNRQKDPKSNCMGIDLNRNWGDHWAPSAKNRCDETYPGSEPFLAPEIKALSQFILSQKNLLGYLDIHAYSQLWMYPFGYTCDANLDVQNKYYELSYQVTQALAELYGTKYEFGPICNTIYAAYGSSVDWAYGKGNVKYPFTIELRDKGQYGFFLPKEQIIPTGKELMQGLLSFLQNMINIEKLKPIVQI